MRFGGAYTPKKLDRRLFFTAITTTAASGRCGKQQGPVAARPTADQLVSLDTRIQGQDEICVHDDRFALEAANRTYASVNTNQGGKMTCSPHDRGTTFNVSLPRAARIASGRPGPRPEKSDSTRGGLAVFRSAVATCERPFTEWTSRSN